MTIADVEAYLDEIAAAASDPETAHPIEDEMRERVLQAIADGAQAPHELALLALSSREIDFARWYS